MNHKDLDAWKKAMTFVVQIYEITAKYPDQEKFVIVSQIRKAAISIPANIAEGAARNYNKEFIQFLYISLGSLSELETLLIVSKNLGFITQTNLDAALKDLVDMRKLILGLINYLKTKNK